LTPRPWLQQEPHRRGAGPGRRHGRRRRRGLTGQREAEERADSGVSGPEDGAEHESSEPDKEGFLLKRSDWPEQWRRRHVALKGPRLFFADDSGGAPTAMVDLRGFGVPVGPSTVTAAGPGHAYALHVATRERAFLLGTDDARERDGWVESLRSAMAT